MQVRIKRTRDDVALPQYQTEGSVCFDLAAAEPVTVGPKQIALIPTGLVVETPPGYMLMLASRSSGPKKLGLMMPHGIGIIDQDYAGDDDELLVQAYNFTDEPVTIDVGTRVAQAGFVRIDRAEWQEATTMGDSRGLRKYGWPWLNAAGSSSSTG